MTSMTENEAEFQDTYAKPADESMDGKEVLDLIRHDFTTSQLTVVGPAFFKSTLKGSVGRFGDNTNYIQFANDGTLTLAGTATVYDDLRVEPSIKATGSNDPTFTQWFTNGAGSVGVFLFNFTDVATANQKEVFFTMQMPHSWKGTAILPHVHWIPNQAGTAQRPVWGLEYTWADIGSAFGNTSIVYTTSLAPNDANLVQYRHYISAFNAITPSATQAGLSTILICRLFRFSGDASDTFTGTCGLLYCDTHFEINTLGSSQEYVK